MSEINLKLSKRSKSWKSDEINYLKENYNKLGSHVCAKYLNRTIESVRQKANRLKIPIDMDLRYNRKLAPDGYIYCGSCDQILEESKFYKKNKNGKYGKKTLKCRSCQQQSARKYYNDNVSSQIKLLHENPEKTIFNRIKSRAKKQNIEFNLDITDIIIPKFCPILNIPILLFSNSDNSPSIDRLDPDKGYIKNNIKIISKRANRIKSDANSDELYQVYLYTKKYWK